MAGGRTPQGRALEQAISGEQRMIRARQAWALRVDEGLSYAKIAQRIGCATSNAYDLCKAAREEAAQDARDRIIEVTEEAAERLRAIAAVAAARYLELGDAKDGQLAVAAERRLADMYGIDAPKRVAVSGEIDSRVMLIPATMTREQWEREHGGES